MKYKLGSNEPLIVNDSGDNNKLKINSNGDTYLVGVGNYDGTNELSDTTLTLQEAINQVPQQLVTLVTYSDLVTLKEGGDLIPGMQYRITDYACTTTQENTQSANHQFDIIVTADSPSALNENARATKNGNDTTYFINSDLESWKLKYTVENDQSKFGWADPTNGKGVIYWMLDEFGNECPYDFKNIMFKRWAVSEVTDPKMTQEALEASNEIFVFDGDETKFQARFGYKGSDCIYGSTTHVVDPNGTGWYYTFSVIAYDVESGEFNLESIEDGSIKGNNFYNDEGGGGFYGNTIKPRYDNTASDYDGIDGTQVLNNIVLNGYYENGEDPYIYGCNNNSFGDKCYCNTFGNNCASNSFGNGCSSNSFGNYCQNNSFGNNCYYNTFVNNCQNNSFGNGCSSNSFGNICSRNTFGNDCDWNTFGNNCYYNTFMDSCNSTSFGNGCSNNSFGNGCAWNSFGNSCTWNSFGNGCSNNSFGSYCQTITVFDNVQNCSVTGGLSDNIVKNAQILSGTAGSSPNNLLVINFSKDKTYTQIAALRDDPTNQLTPQQRLVIWDATDALAQSNWIQDNSSAVDFIKNKPAIKSGIGTGSIIECDLEGNDASGDYSHSEGSYSFSDGDYSHAEGYASSSKGESSHAEGSLTVAIGTASHAEGTSERFDATFTKVSGETNTYTVNVLNICVGNVVTTGAGIVRRVTSVGSRGLIVLDGELGDGDTVQATVLCGADGASAHTEGKSTMTINEAEHAEGMYNKPSTGNKNSDKTISTIGIGTSASFRKNAIDVRLNGDVYIDHIGGYNVNAEPDTLQKVIDGIQSDIQTISETQPDWEEDDTTSPSYIQHKPSIKAGIGTDSIEEGNLLSNYAIGRYSHAEGITRIASGDYSHAEGDGETLRTTISGSNTTYNSPDINLLKVGDLIVYNDLSARITSFGKNNFSVDSSLGRLTSASVDVYVDGAIGANSHVEGWGTVAINKAEHAEGKFNVSRNEGKNITISSIGIGTDNNDRLNAVEVLSDGCVFIKNIGGYDGTSLFKASPIQEVIGDIQSNIHSYTIESVSPDTGYLTAYQLKEDGVAKGAKINIPKDFLVKSGSVIDVVEYNGRYYDVTDINHEHRLPVSAAGKYLDFVVNVQSGTADDEHIYILVSDLVDVYTGGNGVTINGSNVVSLDLTANGGLQFSGSTEGSKTVGLKLDSSNSNGLSIGSGGLSLATVTASANGSGGSNGAMLATDKEKLDGIATGAEVNVQSDWEQDTDTADDYIKNKPSIKSGTGEYSIIEGDLESNTASGDCSHAEGLNTIASNVQSHAEGSDTTSSGDSSHAEGYNTTASGDKSHAEGDSTTASGFRAHSEGLSSIAYGNSSHSEGSTTLSYGSASHAEGFGDNFKIRLTSTGQEDGKEYTCSRATTTVLDVGNVIYYNNECVTITSRRFESSTVYIVLSSTLGELTNAQAYVFHSTAIGLGSHVEGCSTMALNEGEHAEGTYNKSHSGSTIAEKTLSSIGIGNNNGNRTNAIEVMKSGEVYVLGVGDYDGTTITGASTLQSAISTASESCESLTYAQLVAKVGESKLVPGKEYRITDYNCTTTQQNTSSAYHQFDIIVTADSTNTLNENARAAQHPGVSYFANCDLDAWELKYSLDNDRNRFAWASPTSYPAVDIEKLKVDYDQFPQGFQDFIVGNHIDYEDDEVGFFYDTISGHDRLYLFSPDNGQSLYTEFYVKLSDDVDYALGDSAIFSDISDTTECEITSINGSSEIPGKGVIYYMKDEYDNVAPFDFKNIRFTRSAQWFYDNHKWMQDVLGSSFSGEDTDFYFLSWVNEDGEVEDLSIVGQTLMNDEDSYSGVYGNEIEETTAYNMSLTEDTTSPAFALPCTIIVSSYAFDDGFFYGCYSNKFGDSCFNNSFGNNSYQNTFGSNCQSNLFRNGFSGNTFGNGCYQNSFGNSFGKNSFWNNCSFNSFGNNCYNNTFGNDCYGNTFGNYCQNNSFGDYFYNNTFGNDCYNNTFGSYCQTITVFDGVKYCIVTGGSQSTPVKNAQILTGVAGTSPTSRLTITFAQNKTYTQIAALKEDPTGNLTPAQRLVIWDASKAPNDTDLVHKSGVETITGAKTFDTADIILDDASIRFFDERNGVNYGPYINGFYDSVINIPSIEFMGSYADDLVRLTNVADPVYAQDAATKNFVTSQGYTTNIGTVTGVKVGSNGSTLNPDASGVVTIPEYPTIIFRQW